MGNSDTERDPIPTCDAINGIEGDWGGHGSIWKDRKRTGTFGVV